MLDPGNNTIDFPPRFTMYECDAGMNGSIVIKVIRFGNLMDAGMCSVCGEESFGTSYDHIREKDGVRAFLTWFSILSYKSKDNLNGGKLVTVEDTVSIHWDSYGHHYYTRYDYENVDAGAAKEIMEHLIKL